MSYYYNIPEAIHPEIRRLYEAGASAQEILEQLHIEATARSIQRLVHKWGISRTVKQAFNNAIYRGRVKWIKKEQNAKVHGTKQTPTLRYKILERDNFKCRLCGADATIAVLEIDHIDDNPANNKPDNLRVLCYECNVGRPSKNRKWR